MNIDKVDLSLLNAMYMVDEKMSTFDLVKKIFPEEDDRGELQSLNGKVTKRLQKLNRNGLVTKEEEDGRNVYSIKKGKEKNVICARGEINTDPKDENLPEKSFEARNIVLITGTEGMYVHVYIPFSVDFSEDT